MPPKPNRGAIADGEGKSKGDQLSPINTDVAGRVFGWFSLDSLLTQANMIK